MNEYRFEDLCIGMEQSFQAEVTENNMQAFLDMTGDRNPLHTQEDFARQHYFEGRAAYGMLSASFISTLGGVYLPGKYCLIQSVECKFLAPVYIGDMLTVTGKVVELHESVQQAVIRVEMRNQTGRKVVRGILKTGFLE